MKQAWETIVITAIDLAIYVAPGTGAHEHRDRRSHGLVLNDADVVRDYCFHNGKILRTSGNSLFYLPKGSSYRVVTIRPGGCHAINFDASIDDEPFSFVPRDHDPLLQAFKAAAAAWKNNSAFRQNAAMGALYDAVCCLQKEAHRQYVPGNQAALIAPAVEVIEQELTDNALSVSSLATLCGMSEVYFRKVFQHVFGLSPKEYIIRRRMEYAKSLLQSESFTVSEVAALCGYSEPCHFSREFSRRVGVSPSRYIARPSP